MKKNQWSFLLLALVGITPLFTICQAQTDADSKLADSDLLVTDSVKMLRALPPPPELQSPSADGLSPGLVADRAVQVLKVLNRADADLAFETGSGCSQDSLGRDSALCGMRWRKNDAFSDLRSRYENVNRGVKSSLFGKGLARHIELDLDTSPEIKFEFKFD